MNDNDLEKLERIKNYANALYQVILERYRILPLIGTLSAAFVGLVIQNTTLVKTTDLAFIALCILIALIPISIFGILYQLGRDAENLGEKIENILEEDLEEIYFKMPPKKQAELKVKGEQAASQIRELLKSAHIKVKKILRLILDWLRILPGVNHFFLEQEAKIKTDKIIALKERH